MKNTHYYTCFSCVLLALVIGFQWLTWHLPTLIFFGINVVAIAIAFHRINDLSQLAVDFENKCIPSEDPKSGVLSGWIFMLEIFLMALIFAGRCLWLLGTTLLEWL
jgi:4-hydroxybenzoate polyprenyltransferase